MPLAHGQCDIHSYVSTSGVLVEDDVIAATRLDKAVKVAVMPFMLATTAIAGDVFQGIRVIDRELVRFSGALRHSRAISEIRQLDCTGTAFAPGQHPAKQAARDGDNEYYSGEDSDHRCLRRTTLLVRLTLFICHFSPPFEQHKYQCCLMSQYFPSSPQWMDSSSSVEWTIPKSLASFSSDPSGFYHPR